MLVIRGVNVYPSNIEHALLQIDGVSPHFRLVVRREGTLDTLEVQVETDRPDPTSLATVVTDRMAAALGISVRVTVHDPGLLPRSEGGKLSRTIDERNLA